MANKITTLFSFQEQGSGLKKIKADVAAVDGAWGKVRTGFKSSITEFRGSVGAQAAAVAGLVALGGEAVGAASELSESTNAVKVSFGDASDAVLKFGEDSAESYGLSKSEFNEMAVSFGAFATQIAGEGGDVAGTIDEMMTRSADFASVMNLDVSEAALVMQQTLAGSSEVARKYGIDVGAAAVEHYLLENGIAASRSEITEADKVLGRYKVLMEGTDQVTGDFKNTADSLANQQRVTTAKLEDASAKIGEALIPAMEGLAGITLGVIEAMEKLGVLDAIAWFGDIEEKATNAGKAIRGFFDQDAADRMAFVEDIEGAEAAFRDFDWALTDTVKTREELAEIVAENYGDMLDEEGQLHLLNSLQIEQKKRVEEAGEASRRAYYEARWGADAAAGASDNLGTKIRFVRDEAEHLRREIEDEQAWLNLQDRLDETAEKMASGELNAREQRQAMNDLKLEVMDYAERLNLPDSVVTKILADLERDGVEAAEAFLARMGNGVTMPIKPVVVGGDPTTGQSVLVDEFGNAKIGATPRASGGPISAGSTYLVGEQGPELIVPRSGGTVIPNHALGAGGPSINLTVNAGLGADGAQIGREIIEKIRAYERVNGRGWRG